MSRVRQSVLALGTLALVFGLGWYHAHYRADSYQFGRDNPFWAFALLAALHWMAAAVLGVPDEPRDWQPAVFTSALAVAIATGQLPQGVRPRLGSQGVRYPQRR